MPTGGGAGEQAGEEDRQEDHARRLQRQTRYPPQESAPDTADRADQRRLIRLLSSRQPVSLRCASRTQRLPRCCPPASLAPAAPRPSTPIARDHRPPAADPATGPAPGPRSGGARPSRRRARVTTPSDRRHAPGARAAPRPGNNPSGLGHGSTTGVPGSHPSRMPRARMPRRSAPDPGGAMPGRGGPRRSRSTRESAWSGGPGGPGGPVAARVPGGRGPGGPGGPAAPASSRWSAADPVVRGPAAVAGRTGARQPHRWTRQYGRCLRSSPGGRPSRGPQVQARQASGIRQHGGPDARWRSAAARRRQSRPVAAWCVVDRLRGEDRCQPRRSGEGADQARRDGHRHTVDRR